MIDDLLHGWAELQDAAPDYAEAERYFSGEVAEFFASPRIRQAVAATGDRYRFNLAKTPVHVMADRVELSSVTAPDDNQSSAVIEQVWDANDLDVHYPDLFLKAFTYGDAYLQAWPVLEADEEADGELFIAGVELTVHNPKNCRVVYDVENARRKAFAIKRWCTRAAGQDVWRVDLYYADAIERWATKPGSSPDLREAWVPYLEDEDGPDDWLMDNPYGEIPFFHYRTGLPYGAPEHKAGYGCQDAVNKMLITQLTTTDSHGWPQRYALTDAGAVVDDSPDTQVWDSPEPGSIVDSDQPQRAEPGSLMDFVGKKAVGQFPAADPSVFLEPAELYIRLMAQLTTTPLHYFDPSGGTPSGESLKVAEAPLVKKVQNRQVMLRGPVMETWSFVLRLVGLSPARIDVRWAPVASASGASDWEVVAAKQAAGVPVDQTLIEAGYPSETILQWADDGDDSSGITTQLDLIKARAEALGVLIRSGADPESAAARVGLAGLTFTGAVPVTLRVPEADAAGLEDK
ncbi:hypothetical protein GCM10017691_23990 [Pseudonocardia petroleophila]|uniref:Phage portal protein n=1 Tax=Pseudonocardia petroleophila TaxID=37331 RepID=A0A7G7MFU4_9PSEU|nr:phage portal protein [Pseudonocardia petroleophila]QNG51655.1 phage portal protein [Pseudonocardia petroleophila]